MKSSFVSVPATLPYPEDRIKEIWANGIIILDTNVYLGLYRYSIDTRNSVLSVIEKYKDRIIVPSQVSWELMRNRQKVAMDLKGKFGELRANIEKNYSELLKGLKLDEYVRHPLIDRKAIESEINSSKKRLIAKVDKWASLYPEFLVKDEIWDRLYPMIDGKILPALPELELTELFKEGKNRYENEVPPGFGDLKGKKNDPQRRLYGDFIMWREVLNYAKRENKHVILVTDDEQKKDWFLKAGGQSTPLPELIEEFHRETSQYILIYNTLRFVEYAKGEDRSIKLKKENIEEISEKEKKHVRIVPFEWPHRYGGVFPVLKESDYQFSEEDYLKDILKYQKPVKIPSVNWSFNDPYLLELMEDNKELNPKLVEEKNDKDDS